MELDKKMQLIFRRTRDGMEGKNFHEKCDNKRPTITLFQNEKCIFGGYNSNAWVSTDQWLSSSDCFIFSLVSLYNIEPIIKFPFKKEDNYSVYHEGHYGPIFRGGFYIGNGYNKSLNNSSRSNFPSIYDNILGKGKSIFTGDVNNDILN